MDEDVQSRFNSIAAEYEDSRRRFIPDFDNFYQSGIQFLQCDKLEPRVLDLGAGTGLYAHKLLERYPQAHVTLIDFAENMLEIARQIFAGNDNIRYIHDDYSTYDFAGERFDIVMSALSIHHFDDEGKQKICDMAGSLLYPGGEFLNADLIAADSEILDNIYCDLQKGHVRRNASDAEYERFVKNLEIDRRSPILPQLGWLRAAGFTQTDCIFKLNWFAVMYGRK